MNECLQASCGAPGPRLTAALPGHWCDHLEFPALPCLLSGLLTPRCPALCLPRFPSGAFCSHPHFSTVFCHDLQPHCLQESQRCHLKRMKIISFYPKQLTAREKREEGGGRLILRKYSPKCHNNSFSNSCHEYISLFST